MSKESQSVLRRILKKNQNKVFTYIGSKMVVLTQTESNWVDGFISICIMPKKEREKMLI